MSPRLLATAAAALVQGLDWIENLPVWLAIPLSVLLAGLTASRYGRGTVVWGGVVLIDVAIIAAEPLRAPNHHFLLTYIALALALGSFVAHHARSLFACMMGVAVLQKVSSPEYVDYVGWMLATGGFGESLVLRFDELSSTLGQNSAAADLFLRTPPAAGETIQLRFAPSLSKWARLAAYGIVGAELMLAGLAIIRKRGAAFHGALITFLAVLGVVRSEHLFLCSIAVLGLLMLCERPSRFQWAYIVLLVVHAPLSMMRLSGR